MPWDRSAGTHPKYRSPDHQRRRKALVAQLKRDGYLTCTAKVCVMASRIITEPNGRKPHGLHLGHEDDGITYAGPQHNACNVRDGAKRARAKQDTSVKPSRRWVL